MTSASRYDAIIVGGGHNGLVTAGLLARKGQKVLVLERREIVGGAAVTEQPWGAQYKVTSLSYVVSLLPPTILKALELEKYGYHVYPQHGYFVPYPDGRFLQLRDDLAEKQASARRRPSTRAARAVSRPRSTRASRASARRTRTGSTTRRASSAEWSRARPRSSPR